MAFVDAAKQAQRERAGKPLAGKAANDPCAIFNQALCGWIIMQLFPAAPSGHKQEQCAAAKILFPGKAAQVFFVLKCTYARAKPD